MQLSASHVLVIYLSGIDRYESYGDLNLIWHTTHGWTQPLRFILFQSTKLSLQFYLALFIAECRESTYIACEGKIDKKFINLFLTMQEGSFSLHFIVEIIKGQWYLGVLINFVLNLHLHCKDMDYFHKILAEFIYPAFVTFKSNFHLSRGHL